MTIIKELAVVVRTYEKNGETKKVWKNIGAIHEGEFGQYITLDSLVNLAAIPRKDGDDRGLCACLTRRVKRASKR